VSAGFRFFVHANDASAVKRAPVLIVQSSGSLGTASPLAPAPALGLAALAPALLLLLLLAGTSFIKASMS